MTRYRLRTLLASGNSNDWWAIYGCLAGAVAGAVAGFATDLGLVAIWLFDPDLPPRDFQTSFGIIFGVVVGAFAGTLIDGIAGRLTNPRGP